jgi:hypothetical protein
MQSVLSGANASAVSAVSAVSTVNTVNTSMYMVSNACCGDSSTSLYRAPSEYAIMRELLLTSHPNQCHCEEIGLEMSDSAALLAAVVRAREAVKPHHSSGKMGYNNFTVTEGKDKLIGLEVFVGRDTDYIIANLSDKDIKLLFEYMYTGGFGDQSGTPGKEWGTYDITPLDTSNCTTVQEMEKDRSIGYYDNIHYILAQTQIVKLSTRRDLLIDLLRSTSGYLKYEKCRDGLCGHVREDSGTIIIDADSNGSDEDRDEDHDSKDHDSKDHDSKDHDSKDHDSKDHDSKENECWRNAPRTLYTTAVKLESAIQKIAESQKCVDELRKQIGDLEFIAGNYVQGTTQYATRECSLDDCTHVEYSPNLLAVKSFDDTTEHTTDTVQTPPSDNILKQCKKCDSPYCSSHLKPKRIGHREFIYVCPSCYGGQK